MLLRRRFYKQESTIIEDGILTFTALQANSTIVLNKHSSPPAISLEYSTDGGTTWDAYTVGDTITLVNIGDSVKFKGQNLSFSTSSYKYYGFQMTGKIAASGDVTSLLNGVGGDVNLAGKYNCFSRLFSGCTSLTTAPKLPSTILTLAHDCYDGMFSGCTSLVTAPELPAKELAEYCYQAMFSGCTALTTAPELPATTLKNYCYQQMFNACTSLVTAPELPAKELVKCCYLLMFWNCSNLNYIKAMFTTTPSSSYTYNWVSGVAATGIFVKNSAAQWDVTDANGIPSDWTIQTADA